MSNKEYEDLRDAVISFCDSVEEMYEPHNKKYQKMKQLALKGGNKSLAVGKGVKDEGKNS